MIPTREDEDRRYEECGIVALFDVNEAAHHATLAMHALQHRGQEAAGIVTHDAEDFHAVRGRGEVAAIFGSAAVLTQLPGKNAIGHVRYATTGEGSLRNVQPLFAELPSGGFALAHNGNLTNAMTLRAELASRGALFQTSTDTEIIHHLMATRLRGTSVERFVHALHQIEGAYSLVALAPGCVIAARDPLGVRPLVMGRLGQGHIFASETCALDMVGADYVRDIEAGEVLVIDDQGMRSFHPLRKQSPRFCIFEYIYFARPDSSLEGRSVYEARKRIGAELARESLAEADIVVPVPDSGVPSAIGYAQQAGLPFELGIIRNHYVGRTFIEPTDQIRHLGVRLKHNANRRYIEGKRVVLIDDSIVRGTTSRKIVEMVRQAGARAVHLRVASPPVTHSCFYGIDTPERAALLAADRSLDDMRAMIGADSLAFLSFDGLYRAMGEAGRNPDQPQFCDACLSGEYPIRLVDVVANQEPRELWNKDD
ncbi:MAG TPA: amidophosphoribosyltransferase [Dongiaceae bacterium]|nr:amidophosphoribosyltransferase [Dongiaceae bacterium]